MVHSPPVAAAPSTTVHTRIETPHKEVNTSAESQPKQSVLEMMMAESVQIHEALEVTDVHPGQGNMEKRGFKEEPEVVGLDISFDPHEDARNARRAASGMTGDCPSRPHPQDKQRKNFLAKTDTIDGALKNSPKEEDDGRDALSFMARKPPATQGEHFADTRQVHENGADSVLSDLRKNYHAEHAKPPEETAEEDDIAEEAEKWDAAEAQTRKMAEDALAHRGVVAKVEDASLQLITNYKEIQDWLNSLHVDPEILRPFNESDDDDKVAGSGCGCGLRRRRLKGDIPYLDMSRFRQEKDLILFLTKTDFDFNVMNHFRMLRTTFIKLTRSKSCPSIGGHWEVIGFQGGDPRTDINRSGGVFNILQLFYFFMHNFDLLKACWLLSQSHEQHFPMAAVSINITQMVIEAFLAGALSKVCNRGGHLIETLCRIHNAGLFYFYSQWRHQKRTITDTDLTKREIRTLLTKDPQKLLDKLVSAVAENRERQDPSKLAFTNLDFGQSGGGAESSQANRSAAPKRAPVAVPARLKNYSAPDGQ